MDFIYVNILNEGVIPYIREKGPLFGYRMATGVYSILSRDARLNMEITTPFKAEEAKRKYIESKQPVIEKEVEMPKVVIANIPEQKFEDYTTQTPMNVESSATSISEIKEIIENDNDDNEIDSILENTPTEKSAMVVTFKDDLDIEEDSATISSKEEGTEIRAYTNKEIMSMTKAELRQILKDRGYVTGVYAPKYQDNLDKLRAKVKKTQN